MLTVHAYIDVADMARGLDFYCDGLGLALKRRYGPIWVELAGANLPIFLLAGRTPVADLGSTEAPRSFERHWTPVHLDFVVADIDAVVARLVEHGGSLDRAVSTHDYGRMANMADPFGNGFDLIEFTGPGYDLVSR